MSAEAIVAALDSQAVLVGGIVVGLALLVVVAPVGHVVMKPVRETTLGQWASRNTEARMDRVRDAFAARKHTKAGSA